jgi:hypothetical protein
VPTPHLDSSHDAIDAAVNALSVRPANWDYAKRDKLGSIGDPAGSGAIAVANPS